MTNSLTNLLKSSVALWCSLLLLPACGSQETGEISKKQFHRSLEGFLLPFQITWRFVIADVEGIPADREPTAAEYDGIRQATEDWFTVEIPFMYASATDFTFREIECEVETTSWDMTAEWVHVITMACGVVWDADTLEATPAVSKFLTDMNADYLLDNFVDPYLRSADPQTPRNIFQFSQRVGYITNDYGTRGPLPIVGETTPPVSNPLVTSMPVSTAPNATQAPSTMAPVTTAPTPAPGPTTPAPTDLPRRKVAPAAKCGSLAGLNDRGGAAASAKACFSRTKLVRNDGGRRRRRLKGSSY